MNPGIFFVLSIGINIIIINYLIKYYYQPSKLSGPQGYQGLQGNVGKKGLKGPKGDKWKMKSCDDVLNLIEQVKDVLTPNGNINTQCISKIVDDNSNDVYNAFSNTEFGNNYLSSLGSNSVSTSTPSPAYL
jgi:hypothetical protein